MATLFQLPKVSPVFAGASLSGAKLYFFLPGTTTPITTYTTAALSVAHNHPVVADSDGVFPAIFIDEVANTSYRVQLKTSAEALKYDIDNLTALFFTLSSDVISGVYTPTTTGVTNVEASSGNQSQYIRVSDIVSVWGSISLNPTAASQTDVGISLPIASDLASSAQLNGLAGNTLTGGRGASIIGDATNNRATLTWVADDVSAQTWYFTFAYRVV